MAIILFGAMCRCRDVNRLKWSNIRFESYSSSFELSFEKRKNAQFRQENKVIVSATYEEVCPLNLLRALRSVITPDGDDFIFCRFNGRLVAKNTGKTTPMVIAIKYAQNMRYLLFVLEVFLGLLRKNLRANMVINRVV
jgi:hypothetical protein